MQMSVYIAAFLIIFLSITMLGYMTRQFFSQNHKKSNRCIRKNSNYKNCILDIVSKLQVLCIHTMEKVYIKKWQLWNFLEGSLCYRFLDADKNTALKEILPDKDIVNVFVPTAPNPTSGFLLCLPKEEVYYLNMSVEWAF